MTSTMLSCLPAFLLCFFSVFSVTLWFIFVGHSYGWASVFLFLVTVKRTVSAPCTTQSVFWRDTRASPIGWAPVLRLLPRMWTMLGGRLGSDLPASATPAAFTGTRTTRLVRLTDVCTFRASRICGRSCGLLRFGLSRSSARALV